MIPTPHVIESALLLMTAYLLGCVIGFFSRRFLEGRRASSQNEAQKQEEQQAP